MEIKYLGDVVAISVESKRTVMIDSATNHHISHAYTETRHIAEDKLDEVDLNDVAHDMWRIANAEVDNQINSSIEHFNK